MATWMFRPETFALRLLFVLGIAHAATAGTLHSVRFGSHQGFDRVVCEFLEPAQYQITPTKDGHTELRLRNTSVDETFFLPKLPPQIKLITSVEAFREGEHDIIIEIRGSAPLDARAIELQGQSWRLAIDFSLQKTDAPSGAEPTQAPSTAKQKTTPKSKSADPEYVPGDKPHETRLAEGEVNHAEPHAKPKTEGAQLPVADAKKQEEPVKEATPALIDTASASLPTEVTEPQFLSDATKPIDTAKAFEVLAEFFDLIGDEPKARSYAKLYFDKTDAASIEESQSPPTTSEETQANWPVWLLAVIAFAAGIAGGILGNHLRVPGLGGGFKKMIFRKVKLDGAGGEEQVRELAKDLDELDKAVEKERPAKAQSAVVPKEIVEQAEHDFPADEPVATPVESTMKDSLMDRRVKRVLELAAGNKSLADIAQELDMGQDEVKLILDLNS
ncbi:MAG: hypothetical protein IPG71_08785 [bacterium]|nr:hypothetical protein [bacterium]